MESRLRTLAKWLAIVTAVVAGGLLWLNHSPATQWRLWQRLDLRLELVNYSVPYRDFRKHAGLVWLLNHRKIRHPEGAAQRWWAARDYVGYYPFDRPNPTRITKLDTSKLDLLYVADTYGVDSADMVDLGRSMAARRNIDYPE